MRMGEVISEQVRVGGVALHVNRWEGQGRQPSFLLVHGLASNARLWDGVATRLSDRGHAAVAVDLRGHGLSDKPDDGYDFGTVSADLATLIAALRLDRPVAAGQSWGGNVVMELAVRHPRTVRGIVCVDGGTIHLSRSFASWDRCAAALAPPKTAGLPRERIEAMVRAGHAGWPQSGVDGALANWEFRADGTVAPWLTFEHHMTILRHLYEHKPSEVYPKVPVPVLLVPADTGDDEWTAGKRGSVAEAEAALPRVRTHWFVGHHDVHAQYPDDVADLFIETADSGFFG